MSAFLVCVDGTALCNLYEKLGRRRVALVR